MELCRLMKGENNYYITFTAQIKFEYFSQLVVTLVRMFYFPFLKSDISFIPCKQFCAQVDKCNPFTNDKYQNSEVKQYKTYIAFGKYHVECKGIPHDHVVWFLAMYYI